MGSKRLSPRAPAPLLASVAAVVLAYGLGLEDRGVAVVGALPAGLPSLRWPQFDHEILKLLLGGALGVALVSFSSGMVTARSFAARNHYEVDVDQEFIALGACQMASGLAQGFAVTGADSRPRSTTQWVARLGAVLIVACGVLQKTGDGPCCRPPRHQMVRSGWEHHQYGGRHERGNTRIPSRRSCRKGHPFRPCESPS